MLRKEKKRELLSYLNKMENMQRDIEKQLVCGTCNDILKLLADCQQIAIIIGTEIEKENTESIVVKRLEEYCELLFQLTQQSDEISQKNLINNLYEVFDKIKLLFEAIPVFYEIVFMPYLASMWDALESIWLAAKKEENCKCHIIPVPYFERNKDGSLGKMNYEKDSFPSDIPILNYKEYDLKEMKPDVIFIHNPYDSYNLVTTIHPDYYCSELRKYTSCLAYIPYFVMSDTMAEHFCLLPGVLYSDYIFVQSETIRNIYIAAITKGIDSTGESAERFEFAQRIRAVGSPKADKVINTGRETYELPKQWSNLIKGEHYGRQDKKIVLYNTSLNSILNFGISAIEKIKFVFNVFKKHQNVILWWRPHPLSQATVKTMRPELYKEYEELVDYFKQTVNGIYDDTGDMNRAIAYSDAYFGDWSSVILLYMLTGKPILINQPFICTNEFVDIEIRDFVLYQNKIWFMAYNFNALFNMDLDTFEIQYIGKIPGESEIQNNLSFSISLYQDMLIIVPFTGKYFVLYNLKKAEFILHYIDVSAVGERQFMDSFNVGESICFYPVKGTDFIQYNPNENYVEKKISFRKDNKVINCRRDTLQIGSKTYITTFTNVIYVYDSNHTIVKDYCIGNILWKYRRIDKYEEDILLLAEDRVVFWKEQTEQVEDVIVFSHLFNGDECSYYDYVIIDSILYLFPFRANQIIKIDLKNKMSEGIYQFKEEKIKGENGKWKEVYHRVKMVNGNIIAISNIENEIQIIDPIAETVKRISTRIEKEKYKKMMERASIIYEEKQYLEKGRAFYEVESGMVTVDKYVDAVEKEDICNGYINNIYFDNIDGSCGKKIWSIIKERLESDK